ncbi:antibiotic biosynthesis monooxygenase [Actinomadura barringtoniae]|uniref:Antibiotic biosynthesis monooxygenase n=1 Tax=Actinomadura barringtoniae TaxID=1427535 RepID=A0A939PMH0_9ACTN|nr:putative quinol monooxygenase [Actinomadura barringtoniae]MBO2455667.1 antibiotic biosynthesis monooxygenase [Actinomadura barringtoniae]
MAQVALLSRVKVKAGRGEDFVAAFRGVFEAVEKEPGTLSYVVNRSGDDADLFWVSEIYADQEAFELHRDSAAMAAAGPLLGDVIAEVELLVGRPVLSKGVAGPR